MTKAKYYPNDMSPSDWYKVVGAEVQRDLRAYALQSGEDDWDKALAYAITRWRRDVMTEDRPRNGVVRRQLRNGTWANA